MKHETLSEDEQVIIHRLILEPGEATSWHVDDYHRFSVIVTGDRILIEFHDCGEKIQVAVEPGATGWDLPESRLHRAVNCGQLDYHEIVFSYKHAPVGRHNKVQDI